MSAPAGTYDRRLVGWLSLAQLVTWGSVFYTFALLLEPVERELGLTRAQSSLASAWPCWPRACSPSRWAAGSTAATNAR